MIAACPKCNARYRVDPTRIGSAGARLRCARCEAVFRVRAPEAIATPAVAPAQTPAAPPSAPQAQAGREREATPDPQRLVLVADPDAESGKQTASALSAWGLHPVLVHDGVEAMMEVQRLLPRAVILDAALPKMYGFQVCEVIKRNASLRDTRVVLVGAIHHQERYRRPPAELYGADVYLEKPDLPDALLPLLRDAGLPLVGGAAPAAAPATAATPATESVPTPEAKPTQTKAPSDDGLDEPRSKAERLARIIVSDIILYNPEKFEAGVAAGNIAESMDGDLEEGRALFQQRVDPRIREERDFLADELVRVARERGMR